MQTRRVRSSQQVSSIWTVWPLFSRALPVPRTYVFSSTMDEPSYVPLRLNVPTSSIPWPASLPSAQLISCAGIGCDVPYCQYVPT